MREREAHIVVAGVYRLPSGNLVRVEADLGGGALECCYTAATLSAAETAFMARGPQAPAAGDVVWLSERFLAKHALGPRR